MDSRIQGIWLKQAIEYQNATIYKAAKLIGESPTKLYDHINNKRRLSFESVAQLARAFPSMNVRYIHTGEGNPITLN